MLWAEIKHETEENHVPDHIEPFSNFTMSITTNDSPTVNEALSGQDANEWRKAMRDEIDMIEMLGTWDIIQPPPNANIINSRYVL